AHLRLAVRRARRRAPQATVLAAFWSAEDDALASGAARAGADGLARSLSDVVAFCLGHPDRKPTVAAAGPELRRAEG
ncbi:MAG TPA: AI-2E family transporter, partial [Hansschlegelia sp.]